MKAHYRVVVVGGGVVGASVLYHLTRLGWTDIALVERSVLTAGSSWHAAGGFHALNANPNMALLQAYTIDLLKEVEAEIRPAHRDAYDRRHSCRFGPGALGVAAVVLSPFPGHWD